MSLAAAATLFGACLPALADEATAEGFPPAQNLDYYHVPGPDMATDGTAAPAGVGSQYLFLAGSAFTPRTSAQTVSYPGGGCTYSSDWIISSLDLPGGTEILGVRLFYFNSGSAGSVAMNLFSYTGDGNFNLALSGNSTLNTGYSSDYFPFPDGSPLVIDNISNSYALLGSMSVNLRLCGMRVFYTP